MKLQVMSACFYPDTAPARRLIASCERFGLPLHLYGVGETFQNWFHAKVTRLIQELEKLEETYVIFVDAADTIFVAPPPDRVDSLLMSGERNCWPDGSLASVFSRLGKPRAYPYPNAGGFYGNRFVLINELESLPHVSENDQECWHHAMKDRKVLVDIDDNASIFQTMDGEILGGTLAKRSDGRLVNLYTMTTPCIVHFNGGNKYERMDEFERWIA